MIKLTVESSNHIKTLFYIDNNILKKEYLQFLLIDLLDDDSKSNNISVKT